MNVKNLLIIFREEKKNLLVKNRNNALAEKVGGKIVKSVRKIDK